MYTSVLQLKPLALASESSHDGVTIDQENSTKERQTSATTKKAPNAPMYFGYLTSTK